MKSLHDNAKYVRSTTHDWSVHICSCVHCVMQDEDEPGISMPTAIAGLLLVTLAVSGHSELLVGSIDGFTTEANLSKTFVLRPI